MPKRRSKSKHKKCIQQRILQNGQIAESVPEGSEDLEDQNGVYTLLVSTLEVLDFSSDGVSVSDIVQESNKQHDSVSCVLNVENLEENGQIAALVPERWIRHYCSSHRILVVGDGDFSFSASLARAFGSATNMVTTSLDSRVMLELKYSGAKANLAELEGLGCTIINEVDCCTMYQHARLKSELFDRIVFNFPHAGVFSEAATWVIECHKSVVRGFLTNAVEMLRENGEVHITHKATRPFNMWGIKKLAKEVGLVLCDEVPFSLSDYPGYRIKYGTGIRRDESFPVGASVTYKFRGKSS